MGTVNSLQRDELKGAFVCFIPEGTMVGGDAVEIDSWPSDPDDYKNFRFKDTETVVRERTVTDRTRSIPLVEGGYEQQIKKSLQGQAFVCTTVQSNNILKQLENGTSDVVVAGVPQVPGENRAASIDGVALIEMTDETTQTVIERWQVWARLSLDTPSGASPEVSVLTYRLAVLRSSLNTYEAN
jgi:hypothetical protein